MNIESMQEELKRTHDKLARARAQFQLYKKESDEKIRELEVALVSLNARFESDCEKREHLKQKEKRLVSSLRASRQQLKIAQAETASLRSSLPELESLVAIADFVSSQPPQMRALLDDKGYIAHDLATFLCRCGNREALFELWKGLRELAVRRHDAMGADEVLVYILNLYNQSTDEKLLICWPELSACSSPEASTWWVVPFYEEWWQVPNVVERVLLPGLMKPEGGMLIEPLLKLRH